MTSLEKISSEEQFKSKLSATPSTTLTVLYFQCSWAAPCAQMRTILTTLAQTYPPTSPSSIQFLEIDAEELPDISEDYDVTAVPLLVLVRDGKQLEQVSGCDAAKVRAAVEKYYTSSSTTANGKDAIPPALTATKREDDGQEQRQNGTADLSNYAPSSKDPQTAPAMTNGTNPPLDKPGQQTSEEELNTRLASLVKAAPVMLFMKGTPSAPQCGFSRQLVALLRERGVRYGFFNILADEDVRQGLKTFADWPTFPQLWVAGDLVGGLDIVKEELENDPEFFTEYSVKKPADGSAVTAPALA